MSTIQFPTGVPNGTTFTAENGVTYTYDSSGGGGWTANTSEGLNDRFVNADGDTMTGDLTVPSLNGGPLAGFRNQIINGDFSVVQRGAAGEAAVSREYTCDRWYVHNDTAETYTWDQVDAPADFVAAGFTKALRVRNASAVFQVRQLIELPAAGQRGQFIEGSTWTVSIYANAAVDCQVQWRDDSTGDPGAVTTIIPSTAMTDEGGSRYTFTFTMPATAPQSTALGLGVSFQRTDGTNSSLQVTGAQLETGPVATPFEHRPITIEQNLCARYYIKFRSSGELVNTARSGGGSVPWPIKLPVPMRISGPTILGTTGFRTQSTVGGGGVTTNTWESASNCNRIGSAYLRFTATLTGSANTRSTVHEGANEIQLDAEL